MPQRYNPIACHVYDELESLAVRGAFCRIQFVSAGEVESVESRIFDVFSRNKEEFIKIEDGREIRLDRLRSIDGKLIDGTCSLE